MADREIKCRDCRTGFNFSEGEQRFFEERGFAAPIRCKNCRMAKKDRNEQHQQKNGGDTLNDSDLQQ